MNGLKSPIVVDVYGSCFGAPVVAMVLEFAACAVPNEFSEDVRAVNVPYSKGYGGPCI